MKMFWMHEEKIANHGIGDAYFMQKRAKLMGAGYDILECSAHPMRFLKKFSEKAALPGSYERILPFGFIAWFCSTFPEKRPESGCEPKSLGPCFELYDS